MTVCYYHTASAHTTLAILNLIYYNVCVFAREIALPLAKSKRIFPWYSQNIHVRGV